MSKNENVYDLIVLDALKSADRQHIGAFEALVSDAVIAEGERKRRKVGKRRIV